MYLLAICVSSFEKCSVHLSVYWLCLLNLSWVISCDLISHYQFSLQLLVIQSIACLILIISLLSSKIFYFLLFNLPYPTVLSLAFTTFSTANSNFTIFPNNTICIVYLWLFLIDCCISILGCTILFHRVPGYVWLCAVTVLRKLFAFVACYRVWSCFLLKVCCCIFWDL